MKRITTIGFLILFISGCSNNQVLNNYIQNKSEGNPAPEVVTLKILAELKVQNVLCEDFTKENRKTSNELQKEIYHLLENNFQYKKELQKLESYYYFHNSKNDCINTKNFLNEIS